MRRLPRIARRSRNALSPKFPIYPGARLRWSAAAGERGVAPAVVACDVPFCHHPDDKVVDSREATDGESIRRRRECLACGRRFTTYERVDVVMPLVVKKDGRREPWDRDKVLAGIHKACEKRPVSADTIEEAASDAVERKVQESGRARGPEHRSSAKRSWRCLKDLDDVAYVRFASVYKSFRDIDEFMSALQSIVSERGPRETLSRCDAPLTSAGCLWPASKREKGLAEPRRTPRLVAFSSRPVGS